MVQKEMKMGNYYPVLCAIRYQGNNTPGCSIEYITPLIDHKHEDKENGQFYEHYHIDTRFMFRKKNRLQPFVQLKSGKQYEVYESRITVDENLYLETFMLELQWADFDLITAVSAVSRSKPKALCILKGMCPHRGYDLSQIEPENGIITCPLHGLRFHADTGEMIDEHKYYFT